MPNAQWRLDSRLRENDDVACVAEHFRPTAFTRTMLPSPRSTTAVIPAQAGIQLIFS
jgi:hypothetical protein